MNEWYLNETKSISVVWKHPNPNLKVSYKLIGTTGSWIDLGAPTYIGNDIHILETSFDTLGDYFINVIDVNTNVSMVTRLSIVNNTAEEVCACVTESTNVTSAKLDNIDSGLRQVIGQVTDSVQENKTIIEKTGFIVTI